MNLTDRGILGMREFCLLAREDWSLAPGHAARGVIYLQRRYCVLWDQRLPDPYVYCLALRDGQRFRARQEPIKLKTLMRLLPISGQGSPKAAG